MNIRKLLTLLAAIALVLIAFSACSQRTQVRLDGEENLGLVPSDMLYVDGKPQILTVSTESDGDIVFSYLNTEGQVVAQLYGCPIININCTRLEKQGRYLWDIGQ